MDCALICFDLRWWYTVPSLTCNSNEQSQLANACTKEKQYAAGKPTEGPSFVFDPGI